MAKTTSQIQAEKKKLQESFAPTEKKLNDTHAKQMVKIGYTPGKAQANLAAAREANKRREQNVSAQAAKKAKQEANKTAVDKMWDRQSTPGQRTEEDEAVSALVKARRNTEQKKKELEDYQNTEYDWTDAAARELYEKGQKQKEAEISKAQAEQDAAVANFDRAQMNAMSEEDRGLIDEYIRREDTASDPLATGTEEIVEHFVNQNGAIDEKRLKQLVETRRRELNAQRMQETQEKAQEEVNDGWMSATWANLKTVPANLIAGAMGTMDTLHGLFNQDERYSGLDPNSMGNQLNVYSGAVRGQTQQNIEGDGSSVVRKGLGELYQAGMSAADTGARAAAGGALGLGAGLGATVAGLNTFSQTMSDASARGATPEQALALAATTAGIEAATEKVPLDNLIKVSKGGGAKSLIKNILRQAGIEATEEELSLIGTTLADAAIMQEKSEYNLSVAAYMASGMTEEQAREQANWDLLAEAGETAIVSGIAGVAGGFGASATAAFNRDGLDTAQQGAQQAQTAQNQQDVNVEGQQEVAVMEDSIDPKSKVHTGGKVNVEEVAAEIAQNAPKQEQAALDDGTQKPIFDGGDERNASDAIRNQQSILDSARERAVKAIRDYESGKITEAQADAAVDAYNRIVEEVGQRSSVTQEQYRADLAEAGLVADTPAQESNTVNTEAKAADNVKSNADSAEVPGIRNQGKSAENPASAQPENVQNASTNGGQGKTVSENALQATDNVLEAPKTEQGQEIPEGMKGTGAAEQTAEEAPVKPQTPQEQAKAEYKNEAPRSAEAVDPNETPKADSAVAPADSAPQNGTEVKQDYVKRHPVSKVDFTYTFYAPNASFFQKGENGNYTLYDDGTVVPDKNILSGTKSMNGWEASGILTLFDAEGVNGEKMDGRTLGYYEAEPIEYPVVKNNRSSSYIIEKKGRMLFFPFGTKRGTEVIDDRAGWSDVKKPTTFGDANATRITPENVTNNTADSAGTSAPSNIENGNGVESNLNNADSKKKSFDSINPETQKGTAEYRAPQMDAPEASLQDGQAGNAGNGPVEAAQPAAAADAEQSTGMQNAPSGDVKKSKTFSNTGLHNADEDIRRGYREMLRNDPTAGDYEVKRNADTHATAQERTNSPERVQAEYEYLTTKEGPWTAEDVDTAAIAQKELFKAGEAEKFSALAAAKKKALSNMGQAIQAASISGTMKEASDPMTACDSAIDGIMKMKEGESTFKAKGGKTFEQWQKDMSTEFTRIAVAIESVEDGDADGMRDIIRQIARDRKTTAWFGASDRMTHNANRILKKLDFDDLKKIANTQLAAMPDDFKRRSKTEIAMGLRKQSMLTSFKTIARNISGNSAAGFMDSFSDSAGGQFADVLLSKITGKRTVGSDLTRGKEYFNAAKDAMDFASLCVELNIPIETDVDASYAAASGNGGKGGKYVGKTFRSQGNYAMRALYAYQKYMSYALEVSDKVFEGGTNAAVAESLARINNSGLTDTDIQELAEYTGNRRTFKDATWTDADGKKHGSVLSRKAQDIKQPLGVVGDAAMPFVPTPMNVAQAGIDYTVGIGKGITEMAAIVRDAKAGKEISVARQRQAATDFGRGLTGTALLGLFATAAARGIIAVHNDKDKNKKALEQSEGLSGAQINWSAWERDLKGESAEWQDGDTLSSLDFLEPYNTQMYLAVELSKEDTMQDVLKAYPKATFLAVRDAFMDSPMVQGITDIADLISGIKDAETPADVGNELAGYAGDVASSFVPQAVRQAAQVKDGYYRDTRGTNAAEYAKNNFLNAIPGASETLPKKVNGFGQEQERLGWVSTFFDPTNTQKYQKNEMSGYLEELSGKTGDMSIYPERQAPMKISVDGEEIKLTGEQREAYQRTYGEKLEEYYRGLTESGDFDRLTDDQKVDALKQAKEYATQHAKAAVSDYEPEKKAYSNYYAKEITAKQATGDFTGIFKDGKIDVGKLEAAYDQYSGMTAAGKKQIAETADSNTRAFLEVREQGVSAKTYVAAVNRVGSQRVQEGFNSVRPAQKYTAIANAPGTDDKAIDKLMKAYMPDYDPNAKKKNTTELKYDYIRQDMGYSPTKYAQAFDIYSYEADKGGYGTANRTRERMAEEMDITMDDAKLLYKLFHGNYKPWDEE